MTEQFETVFPAHMGMTDIGPGGIAFGHLGTLGFVEMTIGSRVHRIAATAEDLTAIAQAAEDIRANLRKEEEAAALLHEDDGSDADA